MKNFIKSNLKTYSNILLVFVSIVTIFSIFFADDLSLTGNYLYTYILGGVFIFWIASDIVIYLYKKKK